MVEDLTNVSPVKQEMSVAEVHKSDASNEKDQPWVISLAWGLERIVSDLVTIGQVMDVVLFLPGVTASIWGECVLMAKRKQTGWSLEKGDSLLLTWWEADRSSVCRGLWPHGPSLLRVSSYRKQWSSCCRQRQICDCFQPWQWRRKRGGWAWGACFGQSRSERLA